MSKFTLPIEIECGAETCYLTFGKPCRMVSKVSRRCLHFRKVLETSGGWYQRLPECLDQATPTPESADEGGEQESEPT